MIQAILSGQTNPQELVLLCDVRIKASKEEIVKSLEGIWKEEYLFMLQQAVGHYEFHMLQIYDCDEKIKKQLLKKVAILQDGDISEIENPTVKS